MTFRALLIAVFVFLLIRAVRTVLAERNRSLPARKKRAGGSRRVTPPESDDQRIDGKLPHEILGVPEDATPEEARIAYQRLVQKVHPDRTATLSDEIQALAHERTRQINLAYDAMKKR